MGMPKKQKRVATDEIKPHFFTLIVSPSLQLLKLRLPKKFVKDHGKHLSTIAYLRVRNGTDWPIEVTKCKGSVWLSRGWNQFTEHYSLAIGYLLVFRFDGSSRFRVTVFNTTATEIDYPSHHLLPKTGEGDAESRVKRKANAFQSRNPLFMAHIRGRNLSCNRGPVVPVDHHRTYFRKRSDIEEIALRIHEKTWHVQIRYEKFKPLSLSLTFGWRDFALDNELNDGDICVFELIDSDTMTYNVHVFRIEITEEEKEGAEDDKSNGILDELVGRKSAASQQQIEITEKDEEDGWTARQKANAFHSQDPYFVVRMKRRHVHYKLGPVFPTSHCKEYFSKDDEENDIVLRISKRAWCLKYRFEKKATIYVSLSSGWKEFMADNDLEEGDECVFELIDSAQKVYNVHIFKDSKNTSIPTLGDAEIKEETMLDELQQQPAVMQRSKKILSDAVSRVKQRAEAFESRNPFFLFHMTKRNFNGNSGPVLPTNHSRVYYTKNDDEKYVALRVNEKTWHIKCRLEKYGRFSLSLSIGWKKFVEDNSLQEGDICVFELIDSATKTYNIKLFRLSEHKAEPNLVDEEIKDAIPVKTSSKKALCDPESVKERLLRKANAFLNGRPGFIIHMNKSYIVLDRTVHVPLSHSEKYMKDKGDDANEIVIYGKDKRAWKMKYRIEESYPRLSTPGWRKFRMDNALAIGDVCAFKMVKRAQKAYRVAIFRVNRKRRVARRT